MMGKRKVLIIKLYILCTTSDWQASCHCIEEHDEYTHDVKAGLSLCWANMGFIFVLLMHSCSILMNRRAACKLHSTISFLPKSDTSWL